MIESLKEEFDNMVNLTMITLKMGTKMQFDDATMEKDVRTDILKRTMFIISSEGKVSWEDAQTFAYIYGVDLSPADVNVIVRELPSYADMCFKEPSVLLQTIVVIDNVIVKLPDKFNYDKRISDVYYSMSRLIIDVILDDSRKSDKEISEKIDKYFGYIEKYMEENVES